MSEKKALLKGNRVSLDAGFIALSNPGDYAKDSKGVWWVRCPNPSLGLACLAKHEIEEHKDGSITVKPSILITNGDGIPKASYHGWLRKGEWFDA